MGDPMRDAGDLEAALHLIAEEREPCRECMQPHEYRPDPDRKGFFTWRDLDDGHSYHRMSAHEFAEIALAEASTR